MFALLAPVAAARPEVLFAGNSFTHGHEDPVMSYNRAAITDANGSGHGGVPGVFKKLSAQAGLDYGVTIEAVSAQTLAYHLANKAAVIADPKWSHVVLQENSTRPLPADHGGNPDAFIAGGDGLLDLVRAANPAAKVLIYETWASPTSASASGYSGSLRAMQDDLNAAFTLLRHRSARSSGAPDFDGVVRVGEAFLRAVDAGVADPSAADGYAPGLFYLWATGDHRHAGKYGSYLSAVMFYGRITGLDPRDLATGAGSAAADLGISPAHAAQIHLVAHGTLALADPGPPAPPPPTPVVVNRLVGGLSPYNWNNSANWSAGPLAAGQSLLIDAASPAASIVANSTQGSPAASVRNVSFDVGANAKAVQGNATVTTTRVLNLTGGPDALGGVSLLRVSVGTTATVSLGTNSGLGKLVVTPASSGVIAVDNAAAVLRLGPTAELAGAVSLTKTGPGALALGAANTFGAGASDLLDIVEGSLLAETPVSGANSATGAAGVRVREGATLGGAGQLAPGAGRGVTVEADGVLSPGAGGIGALTINGANTAAPVLTLAAGSRLRLELASAGAGSFQADRVVIAGAAAGDVVFGGATADFIDLTGGRLPAGDYVIFSAANIAAYAGLTTDAEGRILAGLAIGGGLADYEAELRLVGGDVVARLVPRPYAAWRARFFTPAEQLDPAVGGDLAAPAGDGVPNLLKYALGLDPRAVAPQGGGLRAEVVATMNGLRLRLVYDRAVEATDVDVAVEVSANLADWYSGEDYTETVAEATSADGATRAVTVIAKDGAHRFARLRVTRRG